MGLGKLPRAQHTITAQVIFRSVNKLLMDTATSEYLFCADFFAEDAVFHELFAATLAAVESHLATSVQAGRLLCTRRRSVTTKSHQHGDGIERLQAGKQTVQCCTSPVVR